MHMHTLCIHHARTTRTQCACRSHTTPTPCTYRAHAGVRDDRYGLHASDGGPAWSHTSSPQRQSLATCSPRQPGALLLTQPFGSRAEAAFRSALASRRRCPLASLAASPAAPPTPPPLYTGGPRGSDDAKPADGDPAAPRLRPVGRLRCGRHACAARSHSGPCSQHGNTALLHPCSTVTPPWIRESR